MIDEFVEITGGTRSQAEQHIAAAAGNFEVSLYINFPFKSRN